MIAAPLMASLPMYDWPEIRAATDAFWAGLARHAGVALPLERALAYSEPWRHPELLFSQTCGYPFTHEFKGLLSYVATPHYLAEGCDGPRYSSFVFAREHVALKDLRGATPAINGRDSMSGMLALKLVFAPLATAGEFFAPALVSGGHRASLKAVREGRADVCAVDAVCVGLARRHRTGDLDGLVEIARSPLVPALPYVTRVGDVARLRAALAAAMVDPALAEARAALLLGGVTVLPEGAYDVIPRLEAEVNLHL
ncbi:MAG: PhnD/SsuA/transferrin family substrate-binding protein [Alphaproteobacteria bacterium]|nr:PhnD/SsuA/transferrin family substrate-binding protein [Alphaproteobacteria bacterium]